MTDAQNFIQLDDGWNLEIKAKALDPLESMLDEGFQGKTKLFSNREYVNIYTICYNMCTQRSPYNWSEQLYQRHGQQLSRYLQDNILPKLKNKHDEFLLHELVKSGENHKIMNKWYKNFFMYLDRYYVRYHSLPTLEDAGLKYFKSIVFDVVKKDVTDSILRLIEKEREDGDVDRSLIRKCVKLYEEMGMGSLEVYISDLEAPFLLSTRDYYARKASQWLQAYPTPAYLIKAEAALLAERGRVAQYLHSDSEAKLLRVVEEELLEKKEASLIERDGSGCRWMLVNKMSEDLSRLFRLYSRVTESPLTGLGPIAEILRQHVSAVGHEKVDQRTARVNGVSGVSSKDSKDNTESNTKEGEKEKETNDDPIFVKDLLNVHDEFLAVVNTLFQSNSLFQKALKDAFVEVVNQDVGKFKTADLISSFCDRLLKTGGGEKLSDSEIESYLEKSVQLFSYLTDKDVFADIYRNQLAKRLLNQRSASDEMERLMIGKLKMRCGAQFTAKMEGMLNDLSIGGDHAKSFEDYCNKEPNKIKIDFTVQVLTTGYWPTYKALELNLPSNMQRCLVIFKDFYDSKTNHRRLQWIHSLGQAVVRGIFGKKTFDFQVVTLQALVLLSFGNNNTSAVESTSSSSSTGISQQIISFQDLVDSTGLVEDVLKRVMHSLVCGKFRILKKINTEGNGNSDKDKNIIRASDSFAVNDAFSSPMRKVRVPMASLDENTQSTKRVEEDRTIAIEAAVVRTMKTRKTLSHQQLLAEVLTQLAFFRPDPKVIKRRIEALIDREYLERDADNPYIYKYLA